jgi:hypothetical protein
MDELPKARFLLNMGRIHGLVQLLYSNEALKPTGIFQSEGARADILRSIVVFLHATFEDILRTTARQRLGAARPQVLNSIPLVGSRVEKFHLGALEAHRGKTVDQVIQESVEDYLDRESFGSCAAVDSVLVQMGLDTTPFKSLYAPLGQMMKRRHRIVHEADLSEPTHTASEAWGIADEWQLIMWLMAVPAFYYQLRMSLSAASVAESGKYERLRKAMLSHVDFANQLVAFPNVPPEKQIDALMKITVLLESIAATLTGDVGEFEPDPG